MSDAATETDVQIDDATMTVDDAPVNLPERVQVVDARNGRLIGYRDREEVTDLLDTDQRFTGFEDTATEQFMLAYSLEATRATVSETIDPFEFLKAIEDNLDTAVGADDPKRMRMGVSYVDRAKRSRVLEIHVKRMLDAKSLLQDGIVEALEAETSDDAEFGGPGQKIVDFMKRKRSVQLRED